MDLSIISERQSILAPSPHPSTLTGEHIVQYPLLFFWLNEFLRYFVTSKSKPLSSRLPQKRKIAGEAEPASVIYFTASQC